MVGKEVEVTVESATKGGKVGCATWTLRQVVEAADLQSDAFAMYCSTGFFGLFLFFGIAISCSSAIGSGRSFFLDIIAHARPRTL